MTRLPSVAAPLSVVLLLGSGCGESRRPAPGPPAPSPQDSTAARVLVVTHTAGFRHDSIPAAEAALEAIAAGSGLFRVEFSRTADEVRARLAPSALQGLDAVFFANTTGDIGVPDLGAFLDWIRSGKAFLGAHAATDTYTGSPAYVEMIGGAFREHGSIVEAEVRVDAPSHPAVAHLAPAFRIADEWYRFRDLAPGRTVLLSFARVPPDGVGAAGEPADLPLAWHRSYGGGRVFYTALGHRAEVWEDPRFRRHLLEGIRWALAR